VHRFPNAVVQSDGGLRWDFDALFAEVLTGLAAAGKAAAERGETITSIGIDTWAVDYGLVNKAGELTAQPYSYRDERSRAAVAQVHAKLDPARLYATTGLQFLQFNTLYQLATEKNLDGLQAMLIPDLIAFLLTGQRRTEATNASTTGLFDAVAGEWATELFGPLGLPKDLFPPLIQPGETLGTLLPGIAERTGLPAATTVVAVGSHDTASAVAAVPAEQENFAYISSGTWSSRGAGTAPARCSPKPAARRTSPTSAAWTAPPGTCATSAACGCSANASAPGPKAATGPPSANFSTRPRRSRPAGPGSTPTIPPSSPRTTCRTASAPQPATPAPSFPPSRQR
jgi:sugar (pentulose or hexulose) kinase